MDRETVAREGCWFKSSHSGGSEGCVAAALNLPGVAGLRDSKDPDGPVLVFSRAAFGQFVRAAAEGRFGA
ncbi:MAG TPA: DUF397 domain-containing protein [Micromonospora sp.]